MWIQVALGAVAAAVALSACGQGEKSYDISSIFPLTAGKCARYNGDEEGSGITATCMVSKDDCEQAAADWRESMQSSGVNDAIEFSCD
jgi:hypothetical protein